MNMLASKAPAMGSKEIAKIMGKQHSSVLRDIRGMMSKLYSADSDLYPIDVEGVSIVKSSYNGMTAEILLDRYHTEVLITGYDVKRRAAVIKRWYELETQQAEPKFNVPQTYSETLRLAAEQAEKIERQQALIEQAKPKVEFVDKYVDATGLYTFRQVCKILGVKEREFRAWLIENKIMYKQGRGWMAYSVHIAEGRFSTKAGSASNGHAFTSTNFTAKGAQWIAKRWGGENMLAKVNESI